MKASDIQAGSTEYRLWGEGLRGNRVCVLGENVDHRRFRGPNAPTEWDVKDVETGQIYVVTSREIDSTWQDWCDQYGFDPKTTTGPTIDFSSDRPVR